jgi:hypothetical protein
VLDHHFAQNIELIESNADAGDDVREDVPKQKSERNTMNQRSIIILSAITTLGLAVLPTGAVSQQKLLKDQLVGTWRLVSNDNVAPDGTKRQIFGANPRGILIFEANGRYAQIFLRPGRPNFKANNRLQGTLEEIKAAYEGRLSTMVLGRSARRTKPSSCARRALFIRIRRRRRGNALSST